MVLFSSLKEPLSREAYDTLIKAPDIKKILDILEESKKSLNELVDSENLEQSTKNVGNKFPR